MMHRPTDQRRYYSRKSVLQDGGVVVLLAIVVAGSEALVGRCGSSGDEASEGKRCGDGGETHYVWW